VPLAVLNAIANFLFIPYYPIWSLVIIALDVLVIWRSHPTAGRLPSDRLTRPGAGARESA
jgi:hypothetical protein